MSRNTVPPELRSKVAQNAFVRRAWSPLALDLRVHDDIGSLVDAVRGTTATLVLRPEVSADRGSAIIHRPHRPLTGEEIAGLAARAGCVVVHERVEGVPHFINGVVAGGRLHVTDVWRCILLQVGIRDILTSVVNRSPEAIGAVLRRGLEALAAQLPDGPLHLEVVVGRDGGRVVKVAPRLASEPLPGLCRLLGIPGQTEAAREPAPARLAEAERQAAAAAAHAHVADYSFVVHRRGRLLAIKDLPALRARGSFVDEVAVPRPGDLLEATVGGETYGATLLLRHREERVLLADIEHYQRRNRAGIFVVGPVGDELPDRTAGGPRGEVPPAPRPRRTPTPAEDGRVILVVGSGLPHYKEFLLAGASRAGRLWLLDRTGPTWQVPYLAGSTVADPADAGALVAAATEVAGRVGVAGVLCYEEAFVQPAASVVEALGLPGMDSSTVRNCRDKARTRRALKAAGIPQPGSVPVACLAEARAAAEAIGYPVVLKPRGLAGSLGVVMVADASGLAGGYAAASAAGYPGVPTFSHGVLVEEYLDGPEISVDGAVVDGRYQPFVLARKQLMEPPYFEEIGHLVDAGDPLLHSAELREMLAAIHEALGVRRGITHTELRLGRRGPRLVEVNARLGGDLIPYLGMIATGVDPGRIAAEVCTGGRPRMTPSRHRAAAVRFLYPSRDCVVREVTLPDTGDVEGLHGAARIADPGALLRLPPRGYLARHAYVVCEGDDAEQCRRRVERAAAAVRLRHDPAPEFSGDAPELSWLHATAPAPRTWGALGAAEGGR